MSSYQLRSGSYEKHNPIHYTLCPQAEQGLLEELPHIPPMREAPKAKPVFKIPKPQERGRWVGQCVFV
jgi:hypothetical protein